MNTPRASLTDVLARLGFASRAGLLTLLIALLGAVFFFLPPASHEPLARQALVLSALVCWFGSMTALACTSLPVGSDLNPHLVLVRVLVATFARLIPPLAALTLAAAQHWRVAEHGFGGYLIAFYLVTLAIDTVFALPALLASGRSPVEAS
ncbi:MAG: hypothetical protein KF708_08085 [Pirellulales bacterium]|nr:hypothetical protein [Pirellulales bacterium]